MDALTNAQLKALWDDFDVRAYNKGWFDAAMAELRFFHEADDAAFGAEAAQYRLWHSRKVLSAGLGETVDISGSLTDSTFVDSLRQLQQKEWPSEAGARARQIQAEYDRLLDYLVPRHSKHRPMVKLHKVFATLLPRELHAGISGPSHRAVFRQLYGAAQGKGKLELAVLSRQRLREVIGPEQSLDDDVARSLFCWYLYERATGSSDDTHGGEPTPVEPLELWPLSRQYRGVQNFQGFVECLRDIVRTAAQPTELDEIVEVLRNDLDYRQGPNTLRAMVRLGRNLGFLTSTGATYSAVEEATDLLDTDPPDALVEAMLVRVFGTAWVLRLASQGPLKPSEGNRWFTENAGWQSGQRSSSLMARCHDLGLVNWTDWTYQLTEYGKAWHARLPEELPKIKLAPTTSSGSVVSDDVELATLTFAQVWQAMQADDELKGFVFSRAQVRALHAAWHAHPKKRFVLLSGLSGTGKTALLYHYARIYAEVLGLDVDAHRAVVPVSPDWRDPSGLLGYLNALHEQPSFQATPALRLLLDAARNPEAPHFLILDEMNLARVERYLAPLLSAMETGDRLVLHTNPDDVNEVPGSIEWPRNLFIGGTVNMDESTHAFSDKVLDRAFTLELWEADLGAFFEARSQRDEPLEGLLVKVYDALFPVRRHFGYRSAKEVVEWVAAARDADPDAMSEELWDQAVLSKLLPRLRGAETRELTAALRELETLLAESKLTDSHAKVKQMRRRLEDTGVTGFWS